MSGSLSVLGVERFTKKSARNFVEQTAVPPKNWTGERSTGQDQCTESIYLAATRANLPRVLEPLQGYVTGIWINIDDPSLES